MAVYSEGNNFLGDIASTALKMSQYTAKFTAYTYDKPVGW